VFSTLTTFIILPEAVPDLPDLPDANGA